MAGGDVYVLSIADVTTEDQGLYVCEVNSDPPVKSFHELKGQFPNVPLNLRHVSSYLFFFSTVALTEVAAAESDAEESEDYLLYSDASETSHDFNDCCKSKNVSSTCMGFCNLDDIMKGKTHTDPDACDSDFPNIIQCMAGTCIMSLCIYTELLPHWNTNDSVL
jgi:hypothetical protein